MTVGRDRPQGGGMGIARGVQINAVEVIARLLGRDRELGLVDQPLEVLGGERELVRHLAGGKVGKIAFGQRLQGEPRAPGAQREARAVAGGLEQDLGAFRKLAHDVVEHVRRHGGGPGRADLGRDRLDDLEVEIGGLERELRLVRADQHVGENRDGIAPLHDPVHMAQGSQQLGALDGDFHDGPRLGVVLGRAGRRSPGPMRRRGLKVA